MIGIPFDFSIPVSVFEKAAAPAGKQRRIGGIISTESRDRQGETILQQGLDFGPFLNHGWFNDNHSKKTTDIVGYPESVSRFGKGEQLPDGTQAKAPGTWAEGYLLKNEAGKKIWDTAQALKETGRRLGFSVEGAITKRVGELRKTIAKARVRNVAITSCPVNVDSKLEVLTKSLLAVAAADDPLDKALSVGAEIEKPAVSAGEGFGVRKESLEGVTKITDIMVGDEEDEKKRKRKIKKSLNAREAIRHVYQRLSGIDLQRAIRIVKVTRALKRNGVL